MEEEGREVDKKDGGTIPGGTPIWDLTTSSNAEEERASQVGGCPVSLVQSCHVNGKETWMGRWMER